MSPVRANVSENVPVSKDHKQGIFLHARHTDNSDDVSVGETACATSIMCAIIAVAYLPLWNLS